MTEVAIFAGEVPDRQVLISGLRPGVAHHVLAAGEGLAEIAALVDGKRDLAAVHLVSHGAPGRVLLGETTLAGDNLPAHAEALSALGRAIAEDGALLLYGCEVAKGQEGRAFVGQLEAVLRRHVIASETLTGAVEKGGDWVLESSRSPGTHPIAIVDAQTARYGGVLDTFTVTNGNSSGAGSLDQAIVDANNNPGLDTITFSSGLTIEIDGSSLANGLPEINDDVHIDGDLNDDGAADVTLADSDSSNTIETVFIDGPNLNVTIEGLVFQGLSADNDGTALAVASATGATLNVVASEFRDLVNTDTTGANGAAIAAATGNTVIVDRSIFSNVSQAGSGAVIGMNENSTITVTNSLFFENTVGFGVIDAFNTGASVTLRNVTSADNSADTVSLDAGASAQVFNSIIDSGTLVTGSNNIEESASLFQDPAGDDYSLAAGATTAIDQGADAQASGSLDLAGDVRIQGAAVDIGAYEFSAVGDTTAPAVVINTGLGVDENAGATVIAGSMLSSSDDTDGAVDIVYTVTNGPNNGSLSAPSFTQQDIDNGSVTYAPDSNYIGGDGFTFDVADSSSNALTGQNFNITVADLDPVIIDDDSGTVAEDQTSGVVVDIDASVDTNGLTWSIASGTPFAINDATGEISVSGPLDFETQSVYDLIVSVDDEDADTTADDTAAITVTITDVNEPPTVSLANTVTTLPDDTDTTNRVKAADIVIDDDALGINTTSLAGADAAVFEIDGTELFLSAGTALDATADPGLSVSVEVDDAGVGSAPDDAAALDITVTDATPPTVAINSGVSDPTNADPFQISITFSESVSGFAVGDIAVSNASAGNLSSGDDTVFTADISPAADGTVTVGVPAGVAQDAAGNDNEAAAPFSVAFDGTAPAVTVDTLVTTDTTPPLNGTIDDNEATIEVTVGGQTLDAMNNSDNTWTLADDTLAPLANGTYDVAVTATDPAGNEGSDASTDELTVTPDTDGDGVDNAIEDAGPNGGDANSDGTPDADQPGVTSLPTVTGQGYMTLTVGGACDLLQQVAAVAPASLPVDPSGNPYPFGLVEFTLPCETATVEVTYHGARPGDFVTSTYRKYGPLTPGDAATTDWYDFSDYATLAANTWTLDLADDRLGDDTGDDGLIVDQGGPAKGPPLPIPVDRPWALLLLMLASLLLARRYLP